MTMYASSALSCAAAKNLPGLESLISGPSEKREARQSVVEDSLLPSFPSMAERNPVKRCGRELIFRTFPVVYSTHPGEPKRVELMCVRISLFVVMHHECRRCHECAYGQHGPVDQDDILHSLPEYRHCAWQQYHTGPQHDVNYG